MTLNLDRSEARPMSSWAFISWHSARQSRNPAGWVYKPLRPGMADNGTQAAVSYSSAHDRHH